jgi:hypothetical protein
MDLFSIVSQAKGEHCMKRLIGWCAVSAFLFVAIAVPAQEKQTGAPAEQGTATQARPADVNSIDAIIAAIYDVISGPANQKRDWARMRSLFVPGAHLIPTGMHPDGKIGIRMLPIDEYISRSEPLMEKEGFFESELSRRTEQFGNIAHVWSTYESRHAKADKPFARGINSIQLMNDGQRWWIVNIMWQGESPEHPLPQKYVQKQ